MEKEAKINYETLFEILRQEKTRRELQKLQPSFFHDVVIYFNEKMQFLKEKKDDIFDMEEKSRVKKQVENIVMILRDLYERREKKIIDMALNKSKAKEAVIDTSDLLSEEQTFYTNLLDLFNKNRQEVLISLLEGKTPSLSDPLTPETHSMPDPTIASEPKQELPDGHEFLEITESIEKFIAPDLKEYGPFKEGDDITIPSEIAQVLVNQNRAVKKQQATKTQGFSGDSEITT